MLALLVALGAGLGSVVRHACAQRLDAHWPAGTFAVNVVGSVLVGAFAALALDEHWWALLGVGLCGGMTTYSGFAVQVTDLGWLRGLGYAAATIGTSLAGCAAAFALLA